LEPKDSVVTLLREIQLWENDLVEVPGSEHHQHEKHEHRHAPLSITGTEMLLIQNELKARIERIQEKSKQLTQIK
jgi:hypothetical protein